MVGRRDYFRQLIFLTFAPISILLFGLHLVGFYGLTIKPALACSTCYVLVSVVSLIVYIVKGPKRLKYIISAFVISLIIIQSVRLLILAFMGQHDPMLTTVNITTCYILVLVASVSILPRTSLVCACINILAIVNPAKRNVLDLKNETCKNREKRNVLKNSHTRHFKTTKKQSKTGCFYSFER